MSRRLAWLGAVLVASVAACADIWQFSDLQQGTVEDATGPDGGVAPTDATAPDTRGQPGTDGRADGRSSDGTSLGTLEAGAGDAPADGFPEDQQCPTAACSGQCVDTQTDPIHCGSCESACPHGAMCMAGACKCPAAQSTPCGGACVDLASDHDNCGGCGNVCPTGYRCSGKSCIPCLSTDKMCSGICVDTTTDISNCGSCGTHCPSGATCANGVCACPGTNPVTCAGAGDAGTQCVNLTNDPNNCGSCSNVCSLAHATSACTFLTCTISACSPGFVDCDRFASDGCEVDTTSDPNNCGGCGRVCAPANATPACTGSSCLIGTCSPGYTDCDHLAANGCEVDTAGDPANCGSCGNVCTLPHATAGCTGGFCTVASCNTGFADCDGNPLNGCETDLSLPAHCGTCTNACAAGMLCSAGSCVSMCVAPMPTLCNGSYCANTTNDVNNCMTCGHVCALNNATATCTSSMCAIASCAAGYADCNKMAGDGCEVNTTNDVANCMSCGNKCVLQNATAVCSASACAISACNTGFVDCDGKPGNGCEINTTSDSMNCGGCGKVCTGGMTCQNSVCACPSGQHNCNGTCKSDTDVNSCGTMCTACPAPTSGTGTGAATCAGTPLACGISCTSPTSTLCGTSCVNTTSDHDNCGGCNMKCPTGGNCVMSACVCPGSNTTNCNGTCATCPTVMNGTAGCSGTSCVATCSASFPNPCGTSTAVNCVNFASDNLNCGGCGMPCPSGGSCASSTCSCPAGDIPCGPAPGACVTCSAPVDGGIVCAADGGPSCVATCNNASYPNLCTNTCVNFTNDPGNCAGCGMVCPTGASCTNSACQCAAGQHVCSNACVSIGPSSCGPSCTTCAAPLEGGTPTCDGSACGGSCPGSLTLCTIGGNLACVDTTLDPNNCGTCGNGCSTLSDGGPPVCVGSVCGT